jgi:hypothetical protein
MLIESLVALVVLANVTVPVVPDPNYLQQLYPSVTQPQQNYGTFGSAPVTNQQPTNGGGAQPTDLVGIVSLAVTAGLGYLFQKNKTTMDRRTYMSADTAVKLAANDQASDVKTLNLVYAMTCMADVMGKYHKEDMETYMTRDGVSLWTYIEILSKSYGDDFKARYINTNTVDTTGTQSKDKVVATFNKVQQSVTPTAPTTPDVVSTVTTTQQPQTEATGRVQANRTANAEAGAASTATATG